MTLNLLPLPYLTARNIIYWCCEHNIDREKCQLIIDSMARKGNDLPSEHWSLEIPEKYVSWFVLKWGFNATEYEYDDKME